jgi:hypothetical protein
VSYDIYFLNRRAGQSWEEAMAELEEADDVALTPELLAAWERIVPQARELLGEIELFETEDTRELSHQSEQTGIQASIYASEVSITVPYWHRGAEAERILCLTYALAQVIENETGLEGYDPQYDRAIAGETPDRQVMSEIATDLHGPAEKR